MHGAPEHANEYPIFKCIPSTWNQLATNVASYISTLKPYWTMCKLDSRKVVPSAKTRSSAAHAQDFACMLGGSYHWTRAHDDITALLHWRMCKLDSGKVVPSADSRKTKL